MYYNLVQWPSQNFKGDLDIDYIWVFISSYVNRGVGEPEKPNLSIPSVGQNFCFKDATSVTSSKNCPNTALFGLI